jgi:hypothetical protein
MNSRSRWSRLVGPEEAHRMRIEGRDHRRPPFVRRLLDRPPDHRLVPQVKPVEIAQRHNRAAHRIRYRLVEGQALHCWEP